MKRRSITLALGAVAALVLFFAVPASSDAAHPRRYEHRHGYQQHYWPGYGHGHHYRHWDHYPGAYYYGPGVRVYRYPHNRSYGYYYHPHVGVQVGPLGLDLWH